MSRPFLEYYRDNLQHIRELAGEFASEFPKIASRLELSQGGCQDPFVERMLEGTAFLAARVEKKLDDGYPRLLESVLGSIAPSTLEPEPSGGVAELSVQYSHPLVKAGLTVERGSRFSIETAVRGSRCVFTTMASVSLLPVSVAGASYDVRGFEALRSARPGMSSVLTITLQTEGGGSWKSAAGRDLDFFIAADDATASGISGLFCYSLEAVFTAEGDGEAWKKADGVTVGNPVLDDPESVFSGQSGPIAGMELLSGGLAHPDFLKFLRVKGLGDELSRAASRAVRVAFLFSRRAPDLVPVVGRGTLRLWCVPFINRFRRRSERVSVRDSYEFRVLASRTSPLDYEVASVEKLEVFNEKNELLISPKRFYEASGEEKIGGAFFSLHRKERLTQPSSRGRRSSYLPREAWISVSGPEWRSVREKASEAAADIICTNADLPYFIRQSSALVPEMARGVAEARFLAPPSRPRPPLIEKGAADDWQKTSYLLLNLSGLLWQEGDGCAALLRRMVACFSRAGEEETKRLCDAIVSVDAATKMFRFIRRGCVYFESGWSVRVLLSSRRLEGVGAYTFGSLLRAALASLAPLNTELEIVVATEEDGEISRWTTQDA